MPQLYQNNLSLEQALTLGNSEVNYRVEYQLQTGLTEYVERIVEDDNSSDPALLSFEKASELAEKIVLNVDNAINVKITQRRVENDESAFNFGDEIFVPIWSADEVDVGVWTNATGV